MSERDRVMPDGAWKFDAEVTRAFDDMLARSIPQYDVMRQSVFNVGRRFQQDSTDIVDLGCSRGEAVAPFVEEFGAHNAFWLCEVSEPMLAAARERFEGYEASGIVHVRAIDLRDEYPPVRASVTLSVLTLMFTPMELRQRILRSIHQHTVSGGVLVMVEKVIGSSAEIDELMVDLYYDAKRANGYTEDQIERKRLSLQGVLVPVTAKWNEELLWMAGFRHVDCFWRWMNFAAWVAVKD